MNAFYLWLQNEVKCNDISQCLYLSELVSFKNPKEIFNEIDKLAMEVVGKLKASPEWQSNLLMSVSVESIKNDKVHAYYDSNHERIVIDAKWLRFLENYLSPNEALSFCLSHEVTHMLEKDTFKACKRKQKNQADEVLAKRVSQLYVEISHHPSIFEYIYAIENHYYTKEILIKHLKEDLPCDL